MFSKLILRHMWLHMFKIASWPYGLGIWKIGKVGSVIHSQTRASWSKSAAGLLPCCHQADIRIRSHRLLRLDDNNSAASCQQTWCKLIVKSFCLQVWCKLFQQQQRVFKYQVATSLIFTDLLQLDEVNRLAATCWQLVSSRLNPQLAASLVAFLAVYMCMWATYTQLLIQHPLKRFC